MEDLRTINGHAPRTVEAATAAYAITAGECGKLFTNEGAAGAIEFSLPEAEVGLHYDFVVKAAQELRIDPDGTETIALPTGVQQAAGKYITANAVGEFIRMVCVKEGEWTVLGSVGTWEAEA